MHVRKITVSLIYIYIYLYINTQHQSEMQRPMSQRNYTKPRARGHFAVHSSNMPGAKRLAILLLCRKMHLQPQHDTASGRLVHGLRCDPVPAGA